MNDAIILDCPLCATQLRIRTGGLEKVSVRCPKCDFSFIYPPEGQVAEVVSQVASTPMVRAVPPPKQEQDRMERLAPEVGMDEKPRLRGTLREKKGGVGLGMMFGILAACLAFLLVGGVLLKAYFDKFNPALASGTLSPESLLSRLTQHTGSLSSVLAEVTSSATRDSALPALRRLAEESDGFLADASKLYPVDEGTVQGLGSRFERLRNEIQELDQTMAGFDPKRDFLGGDVGLLTQRCIKNRQAIEQHLRGAVELPVPLHRSEKAIHEQIVIQRNLSRILAKCRSTEDIDGAISSIWELSDQLNAKAETLGAEGTTTRARTMELNKLLAVAKQGIESLVGRQAELLSETYSHREFQAAMEDFNNVVRRTQDAAYGMLVQPYGVDARMRVANLERNREVVGNRAVPSTVRTDETNLWNRPAEELMAAEEAESAEGAMADGRGVGGRGANGLPAKSGDASMVVPKRNGGPLVMGGRVDSGLRMPEGNQSLPNNLMMDSMAVESATEIGVMVHPEDLRGVALPPDPKKGVAGRKGDSSMVVPKQKGAESRLPDRPKSTPKKPSNGSVQIPEAIQSMKADDRVLLIIKPSKGVDRDQITERFEEELGASALMQSKGDHLFVAVMYKGGMNKVEELIDFGVVQDANPETRVLMINAASKEVKPQIKPVDEPEE